MTPRMRNRTLDLPDRLSLNGNWQICHDEGQRPPLQTANWPTACEVISLPNPVQRIWGETDLGPAWLRRRVVLPNDWPWSRTRLRFDAVATDMTAWANGHEVGHHIGDYAPFEFDVMPHAGPGTEIDVVLRVANVEGHITKGFHDVLSLRHVGVWDDVRLIGSGRAVAIPDGVCIQAEPTRGMASGRVRITVEPVDPAQPIRCRVLVRDRGGATVLDETLGLPGGRRRHDFTLPVDSPAWWSPDEPNLYDATLELIDAEGQVDTHRRRFGFRRIEREGTRILLNGSPLLIRGVLHWGHDRVNLAPNQSAEEIRSTFTRLQSMGFNCVCLCMWYPPERFFDIAAEMGMLIWQEHPNWQAPMPDASLSEYRRLYRSFLRRDRLHTATIITSATCEHPSFHPDIAQWWWRAARDELASCLLQVQTASFAWADLERTDLYDEHTYDNNDRWRCYMHDLQSTLAELPPKPFVMGETVLFTSWPDVEAIDRATDGKRTFWTPRAMRSLRQAEAAWRVQQGAAFRGRVLRQADRHHLLGRKYQVEVFRRHANHAGLVMNHLNDVPACTCGFQDILGRWRFQPDDTRPWLADTALLLSTPRDRRSFDSGEEAACTLHLSNFGPAERKGAALVTCEADNWRTQHSVQLQAPRGDVGSATWRLSLPDVTKPTRCTVKAEIDGVATNRWDLWVMPPGLGAGVAQQVWCSVGDPLTPRELELEAKEQGYSCGFGLPISSWRRFVQLPHELLPTAPQFDVRSAPPADASVILTHRLTSQVTEWIRRGGRAMLLGSQGRGGVGLRYIWMFGQVPVVYERLPLVAGDSDWIVDLLSFDLNQHNSRVMPVDDLGLTDAWDPIVRLAYTHDQDEIAWCDQLAAARFGDGVLVVSALDHTTPAGSHLMQLLLKALQSQELDVTRELTSEQITSMTGHPPAADER
jgi:hypothetical protein